MSLVTGSGLEELISFVLSAINPGPNNHYGLDRIPVCTESGMSRLHCCFKITNSRKFKHTDITRLTLFSLFRIHKLFSLMVSGVIEIFRWLFFTGFRPVPLSRYV